MLLDGETGKVFNIDVTLRDGGYRNLFKFDEAYAAQHVQMLEKVGIEWIEIGYRNGTFKPIADIGRSGLSPDSYIRLLRGIVSRPCLCIMAHPKNITTQDLFQMRELGVDMIRFCADNQRMAQTLDYVRIAKQLGYTVCFNLTRISEQAAKTLAVHAEQAAEAGADIIYLADSNGSMTPERIERLVVTISDFCQCKVGFHAHENIGLAMSNSIAALNAGASFIDSSLRGMGKGAGNLKLELWLSFLRRRYGITHYDYAPLLNQADFLEKNNSHAIPSQPLDDLILGLFDLNVEQRERLNSNMTHASDMLINAQR